jgi:hypothetical protein
MLKCPYCEQTFATTADASAHDCDAAQRQHMMACLRDRNDKLCSDAAEEIRRLANEVSDLSALIAAYRRWAAQCPILEKQP